MNTHGYAQLYYLGLCALGFLAVLILTRPFVNRPFDSRLFSLFGPRMTAGSACVLLFNQFAREIPPDLRPASLDVRLWLEVMAGLGVLTRNSEDILIRNADKFFLIQADGAPMLCVRKGETVT